MGATPFKTLSWGDNEPLYTDKLNAMVNNDQWLFENMPQAKYSAHLLNRQQGIKLVSGFVYLKASANGYSSATAYFGSYFSSGCKPVVVTSLNSYPQGRIHVVTRGIGTFFPDHRGFEVRAYADEQNLRNNKITAAIYVPYIAVGW